MRTAHYLPWVGPGGTPTDDDERTMRNLWYVSRAVSSHTRCTQGEVLEQLYRLIGHDHDSVHGGTYDGR